MDYLYNQDDHDLAAGIGGVIMLLVASVIAIVVVTLAVTTVM